MNWDKFVKTVQVTGAAVAIPAAFAGVYSVYRTYFSPDVECQSLRAGILTTIDRAAAADLRHSLLPLLQRDVKEFEKKCTGFDPEAKAIFRATIVQLEPAKHASAAAPVTPTAAASGPGKSTDGKAPNPRPMVIFGVSLTGERRGWVALNRGDAGHEGEVNFDGYTISETSLPPAGTVLTARRVMPVWREPQRPGPNDPAKLQGRVAQGGCVAVLDNRVGPGRLWAEVSPVDCP